MIRKAIIVGMTLGAILSVVGWLANVHVNVSWTMYTRPDATPVPAHSLQGVGATLYNNILYVGFMRLSQSPLSGDAEKQFHESVNSGFSWFVEDQADLIRGSDNYPQQWRPGITRFGPGGGFSVSIPLWCTTLAFATYPSIAFIRGPLRRWRRKRNGLCLGCGYDLTGNVTGVCSECGKGIENGSKPNVDKGTTAML